MFFKAIFLIYDVTLASSILFQEKLCFGRGFHIQLGIEISTDIIQPISLILDRL